MSFQRDALKMLAETLSFPVIRLTERREQYRDNLAVQILSNLNVEFAAFFHFALLIESELKGLADLIEMKSAILVISLIV